VAIDALSPSRAMEVVFYFFPVLFSVGFPGRRLHKMSVLGNGFSGVSPAIFSGYVFLMSSLEPDLCSSAGSFMTHASLWWRSLEIDGFGGSLLQREVPSEGVCLHALVPVTAFSRRRFRLVFVWVFLFVFLFTVCLCNAQLLLDYLLA
jgi:hypothetical protein